MHILQTVVSQRPINVRLLTGPPKRRAVAGLIPPSYTIKHENEFRCTGAEKKSESERKVRTGAKAVRHAMVVDADGGWLFRMFAMFWRSAQTDRTDRNSSY